MTFSRWSLRRLGWAVTAEGIWYQTRQGSTRLYSPSPAARRLALFVLGYSLVRIAMG